ncbi:MAG: hypothetical protein ACFCUQ_10100 [Kiloniellales bacterium]
MGSKSSSKTSSKQEDNRVGAEGETAIAIGKGAKVDFTTPEAWEFGGKALDFAEGGFADLVDLAGQIVGGSFEVVKGSDAKVTEALEFARQSSQSEAGNNLETIVKVALPIAAGAWVISRIAK